LRLDGEGGYFTKAFEYFEEDSKQYFVQEYIDGEDIFYQMGQWDYAKV